jgi:pimeloyl-ACP methyl ester carboxylesterase
VIVRTNAGGVGYDVRGEGEPLLLLHGFPHDRTLWAPQLADDSLGVRRIAPDLPGFGESEPTTDASLDHWADWVAAFLDALALPRVIVGGLSMGGYLAFAFWRRHPERVRALVLADTRAGPDSDEARAKRRDMQVLARAEGAGAVAARMLTGMIGKTTRAERPAVVATLDTMMRRVPVPAIVDALEALATRADSGTTLRTITVPTLVVCGEEDVLTPPAESQAMHAAIAGSELAILPRAGHASNLEDPRGFDGLLSRFLTATIRRTPH